MIILFTIFIFSITNSWLQMWILLEINIIAFIPLIYNNTRSSINAILKYFFIQAISSSLFLIGYLIFIYFYNFNFNIIITFSILTKLGIFPIFIWFPQVVIQVSWYRNIILITLQKILPIFILRFLNNYFINVSLIISAIIRVIGIWRQNIIKRILAYSSINHISWICLSIIIKNIIWILYLIIYTAIMVIIIIIIQNYNIKSIIQINLLNNRLSSLIIIINFWSLGGLPPFLGFLPKWLIIININQEFYLIFFILIISSLLRILIYTRLIYISLLKTFF